MSGCQKYKDILGNTKGATRLEELGLVARWIAQEILRDYDYLYVFGSRYKGGWRYCSDFDYAVPEKEPATLIQKAKDYSLKFGVMVELRSSEFYEKNEGQGLRIDL